MFNIVKLIVSLNKTPSFNKGNTLFHARKQSVSERRAAVAKLQKKGCLWENRAGETSPAVYLGYKISADLDFHTETPITNTSYCQ